MAASRVDRSFGPSVFLVETPQAQFAVPTDAVRIRRNGIEFRSPKPLPVWTEMRVALETSGGNGGVQGNGVVVACDGNRHVGYSVSLLFLSLSPRSEATLQSMAHQEMG